MREYTLPGIHVREHVLDVPLNWFSESDTRTIQVFAREVSDPARSGEELPVLVFLQGGPGGKSPRPMPGEGWVSRAIATHRVLLIDQRGTGRSTPVQSAMFAEMSGADGAEYLLHFRADSIVADLEAFRTRVFGGIRWQTLGQSYGGFLTLSYLSRHPEALSACYITGGLPSVTPDAEEVYSRTFPRTRAKNAEFHARYPHVAERINEVADVVAEGTTVLPDGDILSVRRLQTLGIDLGMGPGADHLHWMFDEAFTAGRLSDTFLAQVMEATSYDHNPLFAVVHESIYGSGAGATAWAAERVRHRFPEFSPEARPLLLTGEMMFPWMFEEIRSLRPYAAAAEALAAHTDYTELYDPAVLARTEVPIGAVAYYDDMYVDLGLSMQTADLLGPSCRVWVTNEFEHDGLRQSETVLARAMEQVTEMGGAR